MTDITRVAKRKLPTLSPPSQKTIHSSPVRNIATTAEYIVGTACGDEHSFEYLPSIESLGPPHHVAEDPNVETLMHHARTMLQQGPPDGDLVGWPQKPRPGPRSEWL